MLGTREKCPEARGGSFCGAVEWDSPSQNPLLPDAAHRGLTEHAHLLPAECGHLCLTIGVLDQPDIPTHSTRMRSADAGLFSLSMVQDRKQPVSTVSGVCLAGRVPPVVHGLGKGDKNT